MVLKEGIYHLTTPDLVSWWPFLLLAVCFYGFLPRIRFNMGSTVILLLPKGACDWRNDLTAGNTLRMGEAIGRFSSH